MKEANIRITLIIRNRRKWYQIYTGNQGGSDRVTKEH